MNDSDLYPVLHACDTCSKYFNINKMMRRWRHTSEGLHVKWHTYKKDHYCMPCWQLETEENEKEDSN